MTFDRLGPRIGIIALAGVTLLVYWGSLAGPFHFDDNLILQNARITDPEKMLDNLNPAQLRQFTYLTFHINYRWGGGRASGYHLVNLLIHIANCLALWLVATLLFRRHAEPGDERIRRWLPVAAAGVFALHPVQSEAVNYVYQRSNLLAALFVLLCLAALLRASESHQRRFHLFLASFFYLLAVASKETALALPLVAVAYAWAFAQGWRSFADSLLQMRRAAIALMLVMAALGVWALHNLYRSGEETVGVRLVHSIPRYLLAQVQVLIAYIRLIIWPAGLSVDPAFRASPPLSALGIGSLLALGLIIALTMRIRAAKPMAGLLAACFFAFLLPTSSLIPSRDLMFEHRLYLPMTAGSVLIAWALVWLCRALCRNRKFRTVATTAAFSVLLTGYAAASRSRTEVWKDDALLWQDAARKSPWNARAHYNLGVARLSKDRAESRRAFLRVLELQPDHPAALYNLGWLEQTEGRFESAARYFREALRTDPSNWQAQHNLGNIATIQGKFDAALGHYHETIRLKPDYWQAHRSLAALELQQGDPAAALATLALLQSIKPDLADYHYLRACALAEKGETSDAEEELRRLEFLDSRGEFTGLIKDLRARLSSRSGRSTP